MATTTTTEIELETFNAGPSISKSLLPETIPVSEGHTLTLPEALSSTILPPKLPASRAWLVILHLATLNALSSFGNGLLAIGLPTLAHDLRIPDSLLLWPSSAYYLVSGSSLLLAGSIADVLGARRVFLAGNGLVAIFVLACGFARTGNELIAFRGLQGFGAALILPSAVAVVSRGVEEGRKRNIGFASIFLALPLGFALGLVVGGVLVQSVGWRVGWWISGGLAGGMFGLGLWVLPKEGDGRLGWEMVRRLRSEVDWVGGFIASACFAMLSAMLALVSANTANIKKPSVIALLVLSVLLAPAFVVWMYWQEKRGKPALIPNSMWKNASFTAVCLMIMLSSSVNSCLEIFCSLFFQQIQHNDALSAGLKVVPQVLIGAALNLVIGTFVNRSPILIIVLIGNTLQLGSPLLMATINPTWSYWYSAFWAQVLAPMSVDILFTVGTLVVSAAFPVKTQALAGAVFNTFAQLGMSVGLCLMSVVSDTVTARSGKEGTEAVLVGYRAAFWMLVAWMGVACVVGVLGLRSVGKVGVKRD